MTKINNIFNENQISLMKINFKQENHLLIRLHLEN